MYWVSKVIAPLALVAGIAVATVAVSEADGKQPPFGKGGGGFQPGKGKNPFGKGDDKKAEEKKFDEKKGPGPRTDATVDAWVKVLLDKITDPHDVVRESARGAVIAVGPPAIPALQRLAEGNDAAKALAAQKMINAIQQRGPGQPGQPGQPPRGGFGGMGGTGFGPAGMPPGMGPMGFPNRPNRPEEGERGGLFGGPNVTLERALGNLGLSEKQQKEVQETLEAQTRKIREYAEQIRNGKVERQEIREVTEKIQKEVFDAMKKVLNDEQFKKLQEQFPNGRIPFPGPFGPGGERPGRPERDR